jgi:endonuclease YncB( thermonuclease family)
MWEYRVELVRVIDGDTYRFDIDLGFHITIRETVRLLGIDCPEISTPEGQEAKAYAEAWFAAVPLGIRIETHRNAAGEVLTFGRWVAKVYTATGDDLAKSLRAAGHFKAVEKLG